MLLIEFILCCLLIQLIPAEKAVINAAQTQVWQGSRLLLDARQDGCLSIKALTYSPGAKYLVVIGCGFECNDNPAWLFKADGSGKFQFAANGDFVLRDGVEWSADGQTLYYFRTGSTAVRTPKPTVGPRQGWIALNLKTMKKSVAMQRSIDLSATYRIFNLRDGNHLLLHSLPAPQSSIVLTLPPRANGIKLTGKQKVVNGQNWVEAIYQNLQSQNERGWRGWLLQQVLLRDS